MTVDRSGNTTTYRKATPDDVEALGGLRWKMESERPGVTLDRDAYIAAYEAETRGEMERGTYAAWLAEAGREAIAYVLLIRGVMPPYFEGLHRRRGSITRVYRRPSHRRMGITRHLMWLLLDYARERYVQPLILWASGMGRPLYESLGFSVSHAMELNL